MRDDGDDDDAGAGCAGAGAGDGRAGNDWIAMSQLKILASSEARQTGRPGWRRQPPLRPLQQPRTSPNSSMLEPGQ